MPACTLLDVIYHDHPSITLARIGLRQYTCVPGEALRHVLLRPVVGDGRCALVEDDESAIEAAEVVDSPIPCPPFRENVML